jgi:hypothetical protein
MLTRKWKISLSSLSKPPEVLTLSHMKASSILLLHLAFVVFTSSTFCSRLLPVSAYLREHAERVVQSSLSAVAIS